LRNAEPGASAHPLVSRGVEEADFYPLMDRPLELDEKRSAAVRKKGRGGGGRGRGGWRRSRAEKFLIHRGFSREGDGMIIDF